MSAIDVLLDLFRTDEARDELSDSPTAFLNEHAPGLSADDVLAALPAVCGELPPEEASVLRAAFGLDGPDGGGTGSGGGTPIPAEVVDSLPPPPPPGSSVAQVLQHYTKVVNITHQTFQDNDVTNISDNDVDNSVNTNIVAAGDVEFDQAVASGDGSTAASGEAQINSGDGAVLAGDDISDATIATGDVGGSVTGDNTDSLVGDDNQAILNSEVGAAAFGGGDATNVDAGGGNVNFGSGTQIADNQGDVQNAGGDLANVENSQLSESVVGSGSVESNDTSIDIDASEGSGVAFGAGSTASGEDQDVDVDNSGDGVVQVAGDDATQDAAVDNSEVDIDNSDNSDNSLDVADSFNDNSDNSDNSDDDLVDIDNQPQDNDVVDIDG